MTLTNNGDRVAPGIAASCYHSDQYPDLTGDAIAGDAVDIAPHSTKVIEFTEVMPALAYHLGCVAISCQFGYVDLPNADAYPSDSDYATVPGRTVDVSGSVVSGVDSAPFANVRVVLASTAGCPIIAGTRTDANGRFTLNDVQVGRYYLYLVLPPGRALAGWWNHVDPRC